MKNRILVIFEIYTLIIIVLLASSVSTGKKETKIDTELQQCEAERSSIKTEQDSLKQVIKDNVDLTFKLFS